MKVGIFLFIKKAGRIFVKVHKMFKYLGVYVWHRSRHLQIAKSVTQTPKQLNTQTLLRFHYFLEFLFDPLHLMKMSLRMQA
jgi:hypothetical protein